jgi:pyridinium-3,5-biscarboxylic acid mononucleotide sulfurtransferase
MSEDPVAARLDALQGWIAQFPSAIVAYSGGVDSALVAAVAHRALGDRTLACIGVSPSYPEREMRDAIALAERLGVPYRLVETDEHLDPAYAANPSDRCYYCKTHLYDHLTALLRAEDWAVILDGTHADDLGDDRPGRLAAAEHLVRSPLAELGIGKPLVRALARHLDLPVWDKPAMACLSSRVPHGVTITPELLRQVERAEDHLVALGFTQFRVRHHGDIARIEVPLADLARAVDLQAAIVSGLRDAGYRHACLDLAGFRGGVPVEAVPLTLVERPS